MLSSTVDSRTVALTENSQNDSETKTGLLLNRENWARSIPVVTVLSAASAYKYLVYENQSSTDSAQIEDLDTLYKSLMQQAQAEGYAGIIGLSQDNDLKDQFHALGLREKGKLVLRRRYLKLLSFRRGHGIRNFGLGAMARFSNNHRHRIVEADLDADSIATMARIYTRSRQNNQASVSIERSIQALSDRHLNRGTSTHYVLFLRKDVGARYDSYVVFSEKTDERGRHAMIIEDFWMSQDGKRELAWLVAEACIWALGNGFSWVDDWTVRGSRENRVLNALGAMKERETRAIFASTFRGFPQLDFQNSSFRFSDFY